MWNFSKTFVKNFSFVIAVSMLLSSQLSAQSSINTVGGFEGDMPSYWHPGNVPSGAELEWSTAASRSMGRSLKITKGVTDAPASWESFNMADFWSPTHSKDVDIFVGAYVKTEGVNTNPQNDDERWTISYSFYNEAGNLIGTTTLPIDQSVSSSNGFVADTNAVGETILPEDSWKTIIKVTGGKNATGTVYADDFMLYGRGGAWAGQDWNTAVGVPRGWIYWLPPNGGNDGKLTNGFENTTITTEAAHTGLHSLKFDLPFTRAPHDAFVGTKRMLLNGSMLPPNPSQNVYSIEQLGGEKTEAIKPGDWIRISVWAKASNLVPDSAALYPTTWAVGFTYGFFKGNGNNDGWNAVDGYPIDMQFKFPSVTSFDWKRYSIDVQVPNTVDAKAIAVRLHAYARFTGTIYFDDLSIVKLDGVTGVSDGDELPVTYKLLQNYPNPFNPATIISYQIPEQGFVSINIYNVLGQRVATLVNDVQDAGNYKVNFDAGKLSSGIYIYQIKAGNFIQSRKMLLIK